MNEKIQDNLIAKIRESIPERTNITNYLSDLLNVGRESVYRRLRGEINFTLEEIVTLSRNLNISIDRLIGINKDDNSRLNIHTSQSIDNFDLYVNKMLNYACLFSEAGAKMETRARISVNIIPYFFHVSYEALSKLRIYKWLYQNQKISPGDKFSDFMLPTKVFEAHKVFFEAVKAVKNITVIMDNNLFWSMTKDIEYFLKRNILTDDDLSVLKHELHRMIDIMERIAINELYRNSVMVEMYISAVCLDTSYMHFEYGDNQFSQVHTCSINGIDSYNPGICKMQKQLIESQKRYSVLISGSGEMQRYEYMSKQRKYIDKISKEGRWI